jgi:hypothetical protein
MFRGALLAGTAGQQVPDFVDDEHPRIGMSEQADRGCA